MTVRSFLTSRGVAADIASDSVLPLGRKVQIMTEYDSAADSVPSPQGGAGHKKSEFRVDSSDDAIADFVDTVNALGVDGRWLVQGLTDFLRREKRDGEPGGSLVAEGRKTPRSWLRVGGDPASITDIIESDKWW